MTPPTMGERFVEACSLRRERVNLWMVHGAAHNRSFDTAPDEYRRRVVDVFARGQSPQ